LLIGFWQSEIVQLAQLLGALGSAVRAGFVLLVLHKAYTMSSEAVPTPQARRLRRRACASRTS
jgi:hypothetical protein